MCKIKQLGQRAFIQKKKIKAEVVSCLPSVARLLPTWAKRSKLWRPSFLYPQRASQRKQRWWEFCSLGDFKRIKKNISFTLLGMLCSWRPNERGEFFTCSNVTGLCYGAARCSIRTAYRFFVALICTCSDKKTLEFFPGISDERAIFFTLCWECEGCGSWLSNGRGEHFSFTGRYFGVTLYLSREKN